MGDEFFEDLSPEDQDRYLSQPASDPILGAVSSLDHPSTWYGLGLAITVICTVLGAIGLLIRLYACLFCRKHKFHAQDVFGLIAAFPFCCLLWSGFEQAKANTFFRQQWDLDRSSFGGLLYISFVASMMYYATIILVKCAILFEWALLSWAKNLVASRSRTTYSSVCYIMMGLIFCYLSGIIAFLNLRCRPLEKSWHPWISGTCTSSAPTGLATVYVNLVIDLVMLILPQNALWNLRTRESKKKNTEMGIACFIGVLGVGCAVGQVQATHRAQNQQNAAHSISEIFLWELAECSLLLAIFSLPALDTLIHGTSQKPRMIYMMRPRQLNTLSKGTQELSMKCIPVLRPFGAESTTIGAPLKNNRVGNNMGGGLNAEVGRGILERKSPEEGRFRIPTPPGLRRAILMATVIGIESEPAEDRVKSWIEGQRRYRWARNEGNAAVRGRRRKL